MFRQGGLVRGVETELMLTWTSLRGLLQFDVDGRAEEASHLCPAACFHRAHHPEIDPKQDTWTKTMRAPPTFALVMGQAQRAVTTASWDPCA